MRNLLMCFMFLVVAATCFAAPTCVAGSATTYQALGVAGCDIGALNFNSFNFNVTGANANTTAAQMFVTPTGAGFTFSSTTGSGKFGVTGSSSGSATYQIDYVAAVLNPLSKALYGVSATVNGLTADGLISLATFQKTVQGSPVNTPITASTVFSDLSILNVDSYNPSPFVNTQVLTFSKQSAIKIIDVIGINNVFMGEATVDSVANTPFVVANVPEPATLGLMGLGLLCIVSLRKKLSAN